MLLRSVYGRNVRCQVQKTIGFSELQRQLRVVFDEVAGEGVEYVLTRSDRPEVVMIRYDEFIELLEDRQRQKVHQPATRQVQQLRENTASDAYMTMLASEQILRQDWDSPEEDAAWASL